jgi:hypothetical protein
VTLARLHKSECAFRFYVYDGAFDNPPGYFYQYANIFGRSSAYGFWISIGTTRLLSASVFGLLIVKDGGILFCKVGPIPEELLHGQGWISLLLLVFWLHNLNSISLFVVNDSHHLSGPLGCEFLTSQYKGYLG